MFHSFFKGHFLSFYFDVFYYFLMSCSLMTFYFNTKRHCSVNVMTGKTNQENYGSVTVMLLKLCAHCANLCD